MKRKNAKKTVPPKPAAAQAVKGPTAPGPISRNLFAWTFNFIILVFATSTIAQPEVIPTSSMEDNLLVGDHLIVDRLAYAPPGPLSRHLLPYEPVKRGDIIVFRYPLNIKEDYVKRVIGVPGDRIHLVNKQVYLNGKKLDEPYKVQKSPYIDPYRDNFPNGEPNINLPPSTLDMLRNHVMNGDVVVPPDHYFAMGDNRDNSADSRVPLRDGGVGLLPIDNLVGRADAVVGSWDLGVRNQPVSAWLSGFRLSRFFTAVR
jgi:signal peptidase I